MVGRAWMDGLWWPGYVTSPEAGLDWAEASDGAWRGGAGASGADRANPNWKGLPGARMWGLRPRREGLGALTEIPHNPPALAGS